MSRSFSAASSQYLSYATPLVTAYPFSFLARVYPFTPGAGAQPQTIFSIADNASTNNYWAVDVSGSSTLRFRARDGASSSDALTTGTFTANTWHNIGAVGASATDRRAFLNSEKATNTTNRTPSGMDSTGLAYRPSSTTFQYYDGLIADAALYDVALTDDEVASYVAGFSPLLIRPQSLLAYWPLFGNDSPEPDIVGGFNLTLNNTPTKGDRPRIFYPFGARVAIPGVTTIQKSATETISVSIGESSTNAIVSSQTDTCSVSISDSSTNLVSSTNSDSCAVSLSETTSIDGTVSASDSPSVSLTDIAEVSVVIEVSDTTNILIGESSSLTQSDAITDTHDGGYYINLAVENSQKKKQSQKKKKELKEKPKKRPRIPVDIVLNQIELSALISALTLRVGRVGEGDYTSPALSHADVAQLQDALNEIQDLARIRAFKEQLAKLTAQLQENERLRKEQQFLGSIVLQIEKEVKIRQELRRIQDEEDENLLVLLM